MLWGRSGNRCAMPDCRRLLVEDESETDDASIVGDEAHIVAREVDGPRGVSALNSEARDKYDNLLLMCKIHHKLIDDQPNKYSVEYLHKLKFKHLDWVNNTLKPDIEKQSEDEIYATYIDKLIELADVIYWQDWTSHVFSHGQPKILKIQYHNLCELRNV